MNNTIYCLPVRHEAVLKIDTTTNAVDYTTITWEGETAAKYFSGAMADNGKIYAVPFSTDAAAIIDPATDTMDTTSITGLWGSRKWFGAVKAPDGRIFGTPYDTQYVLIIDPDTNTADATSLFANPPWLSSWAGASLGSNGLIYMMPCYGSSSVLIVDPDTDSIDTTSISDASLAYGAFFSSVAVGDRVFAIPFFEQDIMIIDTANNTVTQHLAGNDGQGKWLSSVLADNGKIYAIPAYVDHVLVIDPAATPTE